MTLEVGPGALGTPEARWRAAGVLDRIPVIGTPRERHVLVVAPHPDDEVLGAGGALRLVAAAGARIDFLAVTDGEGSHPGLSPAGRAVLARRRATERDEALRRLDVPARHLLRLGLPDGGVAGGEGVVADAVAGVAGPGSVVRAPWESDGHPDHDAAGRAAVAACARSGARLLRYLVWAWHWADPAAGQIPLACAGRIMLDRRSRAAKRWATGAYRSQIGRLDLQPDAPVVLPGAVLRRCWREFEVLLEAGGA